MNYDEMIERLNSVVESEIWILLWSGSDKQSVVASVSGILERAHSHPARAAERLHISETMERSGLPRDALDQIQKQSQPGIIQREPGAGRSEGFVIVAAGQRAVTLLLEEDHFIAADYDQDGLTVKFAGTALTFMKVYRQKPRDHQRKRRP
jgi:hypothetical protein